MRPKLHVPPCRFCHKQFQRNEHLRRHERTHTHEKPFSCHCGRAFSRRDLLSRHDRLAHASPIGATRGQEQRQDESAGPTFMIAGATQDLTTISQQLHRRRKRMASLDPTSSSSDHNQSPSSSPNHSHDSHFEMVSSNILQDPQLAAAAAAAAVAVSDIDAIHSSSAVIANPPEVSQLQRCSTFPGLAVDQDASMQPIWEMSIGDNLDLLWSDFETSASRFMPPSFVSSYPMNVLPSTQTEFDLWDIYNNTHDCHDGNNNQHNHDNNNNCCYCCNDNGDVVMQHAPGVISRYESRLPSMQPGEENQQNPELTTMGESTSQRPPAGCAQSPKAAPPFHAPGIPWRISKEGYHLIITVMHSHDSVLPPDFVFPSRYALCRYVEGFFSGFHEHLPFIHLPTISIVAAAPELILAVAAVGARYRFQRKQAYNIYLAARSLLEYRLRHWDADDTSGPGTPGLLTDGDFPSLSPSSICGGGPGAGAKSAFTGANPRRDRPGNRERDVQTMQAMVILIAMGTWNHRSLLKDALSIASQLAFMVREDCRFFLDHDRPHSTWSEWVAIEGRRRTKMVAMIFLNLHSIAYNIPPKLLHSEISHLNLPTPETWWKAESEAAWEVVRGRDVCHAVTLQTGCASLFSPFEGESRIAISSFGNYVLAHCIMQQIFFSRQLPVGLLAADLLYFPPDRLSLLNTALRRWQQNWEATKDSSLNPSAPGGPLSFNSTALLRLAYIRLSADLGPCRQLESRDPVSIARGFRDTPLLERSPYVARAVLQSAHSLSIPVRIGIEFVARTQALTWSIVHSLCNLECGLFLAKWLETIASVLERRKVLRDDEKRLLGIVDSIIGETDLGSELQWEHDNVRRVKLMATAVLRLWSYTFKGAHVFDIMGTIGAGLDLCADTLQREMEGIGKK